MNELSTVYTYGAGKVLEHVFNALAMLFNGGFMASLMNFMLMLALMWAGIKSGINRDSHREYVRWFMSYLFVLLVLLQPPALFKGGGYTIHIRDVLTNKAYKVDNLPPGLVIPASIISGLGFATTRVFETVFSDVETNYIPYHKYGTMFGARVMSEFRSFTIQDPVFAENMESFISNCVAYDVMIGRKYDIADLESTNEPWELISSNASSLRMLNYRNSKQGGRELVTCRAGAIKLESHFNPEVALLSKTFPVLSSLASTKSNLNQGIVNALELSTNFYDNSTLGAGEQLKQLLVSNAFKKIPASYGKIKATQNQNTSWAFTGEIAQTTLPILHAIFQAIIYSIFPVIVPLLLFSSRLQMLKTYFEMLIWIELWPILFAVLNLVVSIFSKEANITHEITIGNMNQIVSTQAGYAMCAASLGIMIPGLSYMLVKGGVASFVHMAGSILNSSASGVGSAVHEVTSGNVSMDNVSMGNRSYNNTSANKFDTTGMISNGHMKQTLSDGSIQTDFLLKDGNSRIYQGGAGLSHSVGNTAVNTGQAMQESLARQIQNSQSNVASTSKEVASMEQSMERQAIEFVARMAENESQGHHYDFKHSTVDTENLNSITKLVKEVHDNAGYDWSQSANIVLRANVGVDGNVSTSSGNIINKLIGGNGSNDNAGNTLKLGAASNLGISYEVAKNNTDRQSLDERKMVASDTANASTIETIVNASKDLNYSASDTQEKSMADNLSTSYEKLQQKREAVSYHQNNMEQAQATQDRMSSLRISSDQNAYDNFMYYISERLEPDSNSRIGLNGAREIIEEGGSRFQGYLDSYSKSKLQYMRMIQPNNFDDQYDKIQSSSADQERIKHEIASYEVGNDVAHTKEELQNQHFKDFEINGEAIQQNFYDKNEATEKTIALQKMKTDAAGSEIKKEINKAEANRGFLGIKFGRDNSNKGKWNE